MGRMDELMQIVAICEKYGWTYNEYRQNPSWFTELVHEKLRIDIKEAELANKKQRG